MDLFKKRMSLKGLSSSERNMKLKQREFERWFNNTLNRYKVVIDGIEQYAVLQDHNQNNNDNLSDDKFIITKSDSNIEVGSYVEWDNEIWLTFGYEHKTIQSHKQSKIRETNDTLKWINKSGKICNNGKGYRGHIKNQTLYTLGVNTSGNHLWIADAQMMLFLPTVEEVRELKLGDRMFIGDNVYQIMFNDEVSRRGLSNFLLEQDMFNPHRDNLELRVADYYSRKDDGDEDEDGSEKVDKMVSIEGSSMVKVGATAVYTAIVTNNSEELLEGIEKWSVVDVDNAVAIVDQSPHNLTLKVENNFSKVGSKITIVATAKDGTVGSKTVTIVSPY